MELAVPKQYRIPAVLATTTIESSEATGSRRFLARSYGLCRMGKKTFTFGSAMGVCRTR